MKKYYTVQEKWNILHKLKRNHNWIVTFLCRNSLLEHVIEGNLHRRIKLQEDVEDDVSSYWVTLRVYRKLKTDTLDRNLWRNSFGRSYRPVVRQATE
jgi:hypothetical protein